MEIHQLIYQSQSLVPFAQDELVALLANGRAHNATHHITSLLLYTPDGRFLQVLEGDAGTVHDLYRNRISADPRQVSCRIYGEGPTQERSFPRWPLGFREASANVLRTLLSNVPSDGPGLLVPRPHTRPELLALLQEFVAHSAVPANQPDPWTADTRPAGAY